MRFKIDENLPAELAGDIRSAGHEVETVIDEDLTGSPDAVVLSAAGDEGRVLLTLDKGIGDIRNYPPEQYQGIVLFRPPATGRETVLHFVQCNLEVLYQMDLVGAPGPNH